MKVLRLIGSKRPYFTRDPEQQRASVPMTDTGVFLERNLSARMITSLSMRIILLFGYSKDKLAFEAQKTSTTDRGKIPREVDTIV